MLRNMPGSVEVRTTFRVLQPRHSLNFIPYGNSTRQASGESLAPNFPFSGSITMLCMKSKINRVLVHCYPSALVLHKFEVCSLPEIKSEVMKADHIKDANKSHH